MEEAWVVCLQPLSVDLWLQVLIMAANFKGLMGCVPTAACCCPRGPLCVFARRQTKWAVGWLAVLPVCARLCVHVCVCMFVRFPSSGFNGDLGRVWKAQATPHSRRATVLRGGEREARPNTGSPVTERGRRHQGAHQSKTLCFYTNVFIWVSLCGFLIYEGIFKRCMTHICVQ